MESKFSLLGFCGQTEQTKWVDQIDSSSVSQQYLGSRSAWIVYSYTVMWTLVQIYLEKNGLQNLYDMLKYSIDPTNCRRTLIGDHFGERWTSDKCNKMCDNCFFKREGIVACTNLFIFEGDNFVIRPVANRPRGIMYPQIIVSLLIIPTTTENDALKKALLMSKCFTNYGRWKASQITATRFKVF